MDMTLAQFLPIILMVCVFFIPSYIAVKYYERQNWKKKSPLNIKLLRSPGQSLAAQIAELDGDLLEVFALLPLLPMTLYAQLLSMYAFDDWKPTTFVLVASLLIIIAIVIYYFIRIKKILTQRNRLRLGYECEVAVGQDLHYELNNGFKIYHDFPAENFNIDHIAIGPTGIFAIETKGRAKFAKTENRNWQVTFDGQKLIFPGWEDSQSIDQALRQARWLRNWIQKNTTEDINVTPVLALPGWYIDRKAKSEVLIYNGKNSSFLTKQGAGSLSERQVAIIASQIERECRTIEGKSYKKMT